VNILVTLDKNYLEPLYTMLTSLFVNNPGEGFDIYIAADGFSDEDVQALRAFCARDGARLILLQVCEAWFENAPTTRYYSRAMYYRLLAGKMLPDTLDRILYLDVDMLIIGSIRPLYETDMGEKLYAACVHKGLVGLSKPVNQIRLSNYEAEGYFNSGMLLMNLPRIRERVIAEDIFAYVRKNKQLLFLPDQDILNGLYGTEILQVDERLYNFNASKYGEYQLASQGESDLSWVMEHTAILHFCGRRKPWQKIGGGRFRSLYLHYRMMAKRKRMIRFPKGIQE